MDLLIPTILITLLLLLFLIKPLLSNPKLHKTKHLKLPPSPPSLPFIGHLHLFKKPLHHTLSSLSSLHGPCFLLNFSSRRLLIISSYSLALQCFTTLDLIFATRPRLPSGRFLTYNYTTIGFSPYGPHWRTLRRIVAHHLFSNARLQSLVSTRTNELTSLLHHLYNTSSSSSSSFTKVELRPKLFELVLNVLMMGVAGKRYSSEAQARRFFEMVRGTFMFSGTSNLRDFLPKIFRFFDFQGTKKRLAWLESEWDLHLQGLIDEERIKHARDDQSEEKTMIGVLLSLQQENPESYPDRFIKALFLSLLMAGTDTSTATLEWAMSLLLNHPEKLKKAQEEIDEQIEHGRLIQESDLPNLPYLQGIINETLRLYPATPLLLPHESMQDCELNGFHIPQGTILLVNVYAMHRDPDIWGAGAGEFRPERYEEESGRDLSKMMMPFGMGRRRCPGEGLALKLIGLALGALIQCFEWERLGKEMVDMKEALGMSMPKAHPLEALYKPRSSMISVLSNL
ncbi:cytochrome P450 81Q32-like [Dioscorea cayenensis subsp. rotundata]|uniref:Cytochrome P450 81Q32-like n=1 Tax=Dioscorea cayennensis subsp. rotundata TaxID=55577 RepID=A0AB40C7K8_DIOCR|nr:cytochrome P450 81Q32-like [Dioscorea cayenensis subsp. rotundata]